MSVVTLSRYTVYSEKNVYSIKKSALFGAFLHIYLHTCNFFRNFARQLKDKSIIIYV